MDQDGINSWTARQQVLEPSQGSGLVCFKRAHWDFRAGLTRLLGLMRNLAGAIALVMKGRWGPDWPHEWQQII